MIEDIHLANEGAYDAAGAKLEGLKKLNFIFGSNGSGKTTISRIIEGSGTFPDCQITRADDSPLETRVYNKDFVEKHFDGESSIKGIYTFGGNVEVAEKIKILKGEADDIKKKLSGLQKTLLGEDGDGGKKKEREALAAQFVEDIWSAKKKFDDLDAAFTGLNNNKKNFFDRYLNEAITNTATIRDIVELREDAATVFSTALIKAMMLPKPDSSKMPTLEGDPILQKKIIGKSDVDISALIFRLGNSDWVQQGRQYFEQLEDQCPFCQQKTDAAFRKSLEDYFDQTYIADLEAIGKLRADYTDAVNELLNALNGTDIVNSPYLDHDAHERDVAALSLALKANSEHIEAKKKEPSAPVSLIDTTAMISTVTAHLDAANTKVTANNDIIDNHAARKTELISQVWKRLLEDTKPLYTKFKTESDALDSAITALEGKISESAEELAAKEAEIEDNEKKITSIKPTIDAINKLLKSFGFTNFHLLESEESGFYEVKRPDGSDAKKTLSEGEKSFITFLYFYYLVGGFSALVVERATRSWSSTTPFRV